MELPGDTAVKGYHVFVLQVVCQKRKPQIESLFLGIMHILGQEKIILWGTRVLQATADRGYHVFKDKPG